MSTSTNFYFDNGKSLTVYIEGKGYTFSKTEDSSSYEKAKEYCRKEEYDRVKSLFIDKDRITSTCKGLKIDDNGIVSINGEVLPANLSNVIVRLYKENAPFDCFVKFWEKLKLNPSFKARKRLFQFVYDKDITLFPNGNLLLYKVVRKTEIEGQYVDIYTGKNIQRIGDKITMYRSEVDDNDQNTCSRGLHVCAFQYTKSFGSVSSEIDVVVNVAVSPADVVAIPYDYQSSKLRVCAYTIIELNKDLTEVRSAYYQENQSSIDDSEDEDDFEDYDYEDDNDYDEDGTTFASW